MFGCRLDLDGEVSEAILEARVKEPLLVQVDNVLRYICNGFIADTPRTGAAYTEEERREVFESSVKLLYRCLFLFYAEARELLPSEDRHREIYAPHSINTLCREARKFRWNEREDSRYAAVIPGGKLSAPALFFNSSSRQIGLIPRYDVVVVRSVSAGCKDRHAGRSLSPLRLPDSQSDESHRAPRTRG